MAEETVISSNPEVISIDDVKGYVIKLTAKSAGKTTLSGTDIDGVKYKLDITAVPEGELIVGYSVTNKDYILESEFEIKKGYSEDYGLLHLSMAVDGKIEKAICSDYSYTSSNENAIVIKNHYLLTNNPGKSTITLKIDRCSNKNFIGKTFTFDMTVTATPPCPGTKMVSQGKAGHYCSYKYLEASFYVIKGEVEYEVYMSNSKKGEYKLVSTKSATASETSVLIHIGDMISVSTYDVKPDTKYYFKVRARYTDSFSDNSFSKFSEPVEYWTAAAEITEKISFSSSSRKGSWPAHKGAKGYFYQLGASHFEGYNIFGQRVYYTESQQYISKKNTITAPKKISALAPASLGKIYPITKHGKYYYLNGQKLCKSMKSFELKYDNDKYAN